MKRVAQIIPLGMEIKTALLRSNMTSKELAQRINKSEATVSDVIAGRNRSSETIEMIRNELEI